MPSQGYWACINQGPPWTTNPGVAVANTVTETVVSPTSPDFTIGGQGFPVQVGQVVRVVATGVVSTTGAPNMILGLRYGGTAGNWSAGTMLCQWGNSAMGTNQNNTGWFLQILVSFRQALGGANCVALATGFMGGFSGSGNSLFIPNQSAPATVNINLSTSNALALTATWGTAAAGNTILCHQFLVEAS